MSSVQEYIQSGLLELYVAGNTTPEQTVAVEQMAVMHTAIADEITSIASAIEGYAELNGILPDPTIKPFLMATIDYSERIKNGETISFPPMINQHSSIADYKHWLNREDMVAPDFLPDMYAKIIGHTDKMTTAIIWLKQMAPQEVHHDEIEQFLIVEGSCDITIGTTVHQLSAGKMLSIPLHLPHFVKVTSAIPCKLILQRIAA